MAREKLLLNLERRLERATRDSDWDALSEIDAELSLQLAPFVGRGGWNNAEQRALVALQLAHRRARQQCDIELKRLGRVLEEMRNNKEGWLAYAKSADPEEGNLP